MTSSDEASMTSGYARYLAAKTTVDDRALNGHVLAELRRLMPAGAPRVLEVGAGLGTMVARLMDWGVVGTGEYILLDTDRQLLDHSRRWLRDWAAARGLRSDLLPDGLQVGDLRVRLVHAELGSYLETDHGALADVLIANAVLDLVDVPAILPGLLRLLVPGGVYWFTINYDGESIFAPGHPHDDQVMQAYHRDMDERVRYGQPAGESRTGRHLFHHLRAAGAPALAAGSSDWVVSAGPDGNYPGDEANFLRSILSTIQDALRSRQDWVDPADLADWLAVRTGNWLRASWSTSPTSLISRAGRPASTHGAAQSIRGAEVRRAGVPVRFGGAFKTPRQQIMPSAPGLGGQVGGVGLVEVQGGGDLPGDRDAQAGQLSALVRVVAQQRDTAGTERVQHLGRAGVVAFVGPVAEREIRVVRVQATILQRVGVELLVQSDAPSLLAQVQHVPAAFGDPLDCFAQLRPAVASLAAEHVTGEAFTVQAHQR